jgi:acid phosphatase family membrane protein YuiD
MLDVVRDMPFITAILAGILCQMVKVVSFLVLEKRVNYRRFVQPDGAPNLHSATFSALTVAVGLAGGFDSIVFALSVCMTAIVLVDTMNVRNAASRQAELVELLLERLRRKGSKGTPKRLGNSYTPVDVLSGVLLGVLFALVVYG